MIFFNTIYIYIYIYIYFWCQQETQPKIQKDMLTCQTRCYLNGIGFNLYSVSRPIKIVLKSCIELTPSLPGGLEILKQSYIRKFKIELLTPIIWMPKPSNVWCEFYAMRQNKYIYILYIYIHRIYHIQSPACLLLALIARHDRVKEKDRASGV